MGCTARDILIEQPQLAPVHTFNPITTPNPHVDLRFSHAIKCIFFAVRNKTIPNEWSNYTTSSLVVGPNEVTLSADAVDPILHTSLVYENTTRLTEMGSDYFSLINPYYHAVSVPTETGYHMYSYALNLLDNDPLGSTNYGKLTNVSIIPQASTNAVLGAQGDGIAGGGMDFAQKYDFVVCGLNHIIIRISGGALGFPVL